MESAEEAELTSNPADQRGLCLLSLDGGGIRGLSSLRILQRLMTKVNAERRKTGLNAVKPCELFDLIGGTSTGGLIAIMLGRLKMDVQECIDAYQKMTTEIFKKKQLVPIDFLGRVKGRFDTQGLTESIKSAMALAGASDEARLESEEELCKIFVCAMSCETKNVVRLKSYRLDDDSEIRPTILEAARATSAATGFFEPATIGNRKFADGALGANNPVDEVWSEAQNIWCERDGELEPLISCFISIGTGDPGIEPMNDGILKVLAKDMVKLATETTQTARRFEARHRGLFEQKKYFRFNVEQGLQNVKLDKHERMGDVDAVTDLYLEHYSQKSRLNDCVGRLKLKRDKSPSNLAATINGYRATQVKHQLAEAGTIHSADPQFIENVNFVGRGRELKAIEQQFISAKAQPCQGRVCLWGPGGVGKTQLAATYALRSRRRYAKIFKISARSVESIQEDFARIIYQVTSIEPPGAPPEASPDPERRSQQEPTQRNIRAVHEWFLTYNANWLLIIDDVSLPEVDIDGFIPRTNGGDVIITSQNRQVGGYGFLVEVGQLSPDEAVTILLNKANIFDDHLRSAAYVQAKEIAKKLGYLALAVEHAGALIGYKGMDYYWQSLNSDRARVLDQPEDKSTHHRESVFKTFNLSFEILRDKHYRAAQLLVLLSHLENTTVSEEMFLPGGSRAKGIEHIKLFEDHLGFLDIVGELHAFALVYRTVQGDVIYLSLHPLVHWMSRKRLSDTHQWNWNLNAVKFLATPKYDPTTQEIFSGGRLFEHLVHVLELSMTFKQELQPRENMIQLWGLLTILMTDHVLHWHSLGRMEQLARFSRHAVSVLGYPTSELAVFTSMMSANIYSDATQYSNDPETPSSILKRFLASQINSSAIAALDRSAGISQPRPPNFNIIVPRMSIWPMSMTRLLKIRMSEPNMKVFALSLRKMSLMYVGRKRWTEAMLLAKLSELPLTVWGKPVYDFGTSTSKMVQNAFQAAHGGDVDGILDHFHQLGHHDDDWAIFVMYDYCKILNRKQRHSEVETAIEHLRLKGHISDPQPMAPTEKGHLHSWFTKVLVAALTAQDRVPEARELLHRSYQSIKDASTDDNLSLLHSECLMILFHRQWQQDPPSFVEQYETDLQERFRRMYASDRSQLLKAEGLAMACILRAQGALEETIMVTKVFILISTEILGVAHPLTARAKRVLDATMMESKRETQYEEQGDYWLHFGSVTFPREAKALACWGKNSPTILDTQSWREAARPPPRHGKISVDGAASGLRRREWLALIVILISAGLTVKLEVFTPHGPSVVFALGILATSWVAIRLAQSYGISTSLGTLVRKR